MLILQEINTEIIEDRFRSLTIFEFQSRFPDNDTCFKYLAELKWGAGFCCPHKLLQWQKKTRQTVSQLPPDQFTCKRDAFSQG